MKLKLASLFVVFAVLVITCISIAGQLPKTSNTVSNEVIKDLVGTDNNAGLIILYGGDTRGNIDTCG